MVGDELAAVRIADERAADAGRRWDDSEFVPFTPGLPVEGLDENGIVIQGVAGRMYTAGANCKGRVIQHVLTEDGVIHWCRKRDLSPVARALAEREGK